MNLWRHDVIACYPHIFITYCIGSTADLQDIIKQWPIACVLPMCTTDSSISIIKSNLSYFRHHITRLEADFNFTSDCGVTFECIFAGTGKSERDGDCEEPVSCIIGRFIYLVTPAGRTDEATTTKTPTTPTENKQRACPRIRMCLHLTHCGLVCAYTWCYP